jgi:hypothetical protein
MNQMSQLDAAAIVATGEPLPTEMMSDPSLRSEVEGMMSRPVFDGEKIVDQAAE